MKSSLAFLLYIASTASAFTVTSPRCAASKMTRRSQQFAPLATTTGISDEETTSEKTELSSEESWQIQLESKEVQEVRQELIQKYISLGRTMEYAEVEVDKFLSDPERSQKFLEMRRYAKAQANELMGFETAVTIGGAFFVGLFGNVLIKYIAAYKDVYPGHDGPIPFL